MKKENQRKFCIALCLLTAFAVWTAAVRLVDVQPIGPQESGVGFASLNRFVQDLTGVHLSLYSITDWLGLIPLGFVMGFAVLGLVQWIQRNDIRKVDSSILWLGGFYLAVMTVFVFFEEFVVNYRPIRIEGILEASYPSSTTLLVMCVMPTAGMQLRTRIENRGFRRCIVWAIHAFTAFMVIGRLLSGVHWFTDILGGILVSGGLVMLYSAFSGLE